MEPTGLPPLPGIDTREGMKYLMNKVSLYERVLRDFHRRSHDQGGRIAAALAADERDTAQRLAHNTKGLSATIGARSLHLAALALEQAIAGDQPCDELLQAFDRELRIVTDGIARGFGLAPPPLD